jgi:hypothetical protein
LLYEWRIDAAQPELLFATIALNAKGITIVDGVLTQRKDCVSLGGFASLGLSLLGCWEK